MTLPRVGCIIEGGAAASLDTQTHFEQYSAAIFSMFKFQGTTTWASTLRATYPGLKMILGYQIAGELRTSGVESGVLKSEADTHDGGLSGATNDYWVLRNNANWTLGVPSGAYNATPGNGSTIDYIGNVNSSTFQTRWAANAIARCQAAGIDGLFIDNVLGYTNGMVAFNPQTGVQYTDATWAAAMAAFCAAIAPTFANAGLYLLPNTFDGTGLTPGEIVWWDTVTQQGAFNPMVETWMQNGSQGTTARSDAQANNAFFSSWMQQPAAAIGRSRDFHVEVSSVTADAFMRTYHYAAFLLRWDGNTSGRSRLWLDGGGSTGDQSSWSTTQVDPGTPAYRVQEVNADGTLAANRLATSLYRRYYSRGIVYANAHATNNYTITSFGDTRVYRDNTGAQVTTPVTVNALRALILTADTTYAAPADPAPWTRIATALPGSSVASMSKYGLVLDGPVQVNDLVVVVTTRSFGSNDLASETVTDNLGNVYTQVPSTNWDSSDVQSLAMYWSAITKPGIPALFGNWPNPSNFSQADAMAYRKPGFKPALDVSATMTGNPQRGTVAGAGTDTVAVPGGLTTTANGELVAGSFANVSSGSALAPGTGFADSAGAVGGGIILEALVQANAGAVAVTASPGGAMNYVGVAAAFKPVAVSGAGSMPLKGA